MIVTVSVTMIIFINTLLLYNYFNLEHLSLFLCNINIWIKSSLIIIWILKR